MGKINNIEEVGILELKPYEKNAKKHSKKQVKMIANSIEEFGFLTPCLIDKDKNIIAGHGRIEAAKMLNMEKVPCVYVEGLTDEQRRAYILADNKLGEMAEWDMDLVSEELIDLEALGFDISVTGFELDFDSGEEAKEDEYDQAPPEVPKAKRGDLYQLGRHRLLCGDSTSEDDLKILMNGAQADMLLTDPPYNVALGMGGSKDDARLRHRRTDGLVIMNDKMEDAEFRKFLTTVFSNAKNFMKAGAAFYIWYVDNEGYNFRGAAIDAELQMRENLIWVKQTFTLGRQDYQWQHEPCLYGWNAGTHQWYSDRKQSTVLKFDKPSKSKIHPTMKPVALFDYQMKNSSKEGDIILDLFGGSGTTIMAAEQNNRCGYLMELDPRYVDAIINRWEEFTKQKAVKLIDGYREEVEEGTEATK